MLEIIKKYADSLETEAIPQLSVNCVILGFHENTLRVVVNRISAGETTLMLLPGGYVKQTEDLTDAVKRVVKESTGLENILPRQFAVFGKASRSFVSDIAGVLGSRSDVDPSAIDWLTRRFISLGYLALVDYHSIDLKPIQFFDTVRWLSVDQADTLAMDHADMLRSAREFLVKEMPYMPVASNLLPPQFTLPDLQVLVEAILGRTIDRPNFRRKILGTGMLEKIGVDRSSGRRPADLYRFKHGKNTSLMDAYKFGF
jgi:ADP-ribose pyrophosphatase YjhB (NUDIX family)